MPLLTTPSEDGKEAFLAALSGTELTSGSEAGIGMSPAHHQRSPEPEGHPGAPKKKRAKLTHLGGEA